jgi:ribonuclease G
LPFFRRKKATAEEAVAAGTPVAVAEVVADSPAASGGETPKPKRRRGSRGGRGRSKKPTEAKPGSAAGAEKTGEPKPERRKPAAKPATASKPPAKSRRSTTRRRQPPRRPPLPAAKRELLVSVDVSEKRVAIFEDEQVAEVYLERPERRSIAGNIYKGTVDNVLPGMEAAFVEIGLEKNGFLYVDEIVVPELEGRRHGRKIQDLLSRGQDILVQAVKDPMKTKGARLTTEISLPGRFIVFVPNGEGLGVSRRLEDDERNRLRDILKELEMPRGGVIVRTAAEGASAEDIERDLVFLQRLWRTIEARAKQVAAPALVYQEAELPLRVVRDLFTEDFERAVVDHDRTYKRIVGYLKKTSPHMVERVVRYKEKQPLFEQFGVDDEIRSTLSRRVDLPSGGYLVFDYAEAFTVVDVNTGRFVGSRSKGSGGGLEDTITKNNLEAVKEVVRQLRLRDIGGIIVIDFIDMANPKNRATVEEALKTELERDRTKTYVVEISPLGLVEMTRQNVTDGPREILTKKCPTCAGDGIVYSEASAAVDAERRLRALVAGSRSAAFRVELSARVAPILVGPGGERLIEIEAQTKRRFAIESAPDVPVDHFRVVAQGPVEQLVPEPPVEEGSELEVKLVEIGLHDATSAIGKLDGYSVTVADAAKLVGKKVKVRVGRFLDGTAYASLVAPSEVEAPITAESEAEKPTRKPPARKSAAAGEAAAEAVADEPEAEEAEDAVAEPEAEGEAETEAETEGAIESEGAAETEGGAKPARKRTRRGSRGGRGRKRKPAAEAGTGEAAEGEAPSAENGGEPASDGRPSAAPRIHVPDPELGRDAPAEVEVEAPAEADGDAPEDGTPRKRKTRRGSRGGRNRRKRTTAAAVQATAGEPASEASGPDET